MSITLNEIHKDGDTTFQIQGNHEYIISTNLYADGSIHRSVLIGDIAIEDTFESWNWGASTEEYRLSGWYTPNAKKTTENGLIYLGNGEYTPSEISIKTAHREEIKISKNPPGTWRPIIDNNEVETLRTIEFIYNSFPNSDDSKVDKYKDSKDPLVKTSPTTNRSGLKKFNMEQLLPENWWENPFEIVSSKNGDQPDNDLGNSDISKELHLITLPESFGKKSADKITNFNPSTDTLEIDTDSFGIDSSATLASGKNKKKVKKKLAKQDFDFLYDQKKGGLYFNENGSDKGFGDGGIIAILKGAPDLRESNLEFI